MELKPLTGAAQIDKAFDLLRTRIHEGAIRCDLKLLIPAHPQQHTAYRHAQERLWAVLYNDLLQTTVSRLSGQQERNRRRRFMLSAMAAVISIIAGWLLSAVSPTTLLHLFSR